MREAGCMFRTAWELKSDWRAVCTSTRSDRTAQTGSDRAHEPSVAYAHVSASRPHDEELPFSRNALKQGTNALQKRQRIISAGKRSQKMSEQETRERARALQL